MHPKEKEYHAREAVSTLVATIESDQEFFEDVRESIEALERRDMESVDGMPTLSFPSYDELLKTFTPRTLELINTVRREEPASINEAARATGRDVKNVHDNLKQLESAGVIYFEESGRSKRPVVWFDELDIRLPIDRPENSAESATAD